MHPSKFGDTYEMAKLCVLDWLIPEKEWLIHPMYFPRNGEERDETFPCRYADFLGLRLVNGDIWQRRNLVNAVAEESGHLFLDPDTGLQLDAARRGKFVSAGELIEIARSPAREGKLVLVYDQSVNFDEGKAGTRRQQVRRKLCRLHDAKVHTVAYVSHIAFIWASTDPEVVCAATRRLLLASRLPGCRFVLFCNWVDCYDRLLVNCRQPALFLQA